MAVAESEPRDEHRALATTAARGGAVTFAAQAVRQIVVLGMSIVLARLLTPADFGTFAVAVSITLYLSHVSEIGLAWALIQKPAVSPNDVATALTCNVVAGTVAGGAVFAAADAVSRLLHSPDSAPLLRTLAVLVPLQALTGTHRALLRRELAFRRLAVIDTAAVVTAAAVGLAVALSTRTVAGLVGMQATLIVVTSAGLLWTKRTVPRARPGLRSARSLSGFATSQIAFETITYWGRTLDNLLVARSFGTTTLGLYSRAFALVQRPAAELQSVAGTVAFPVLARNQADHAWLATFTARLMGAVTAVTYPLFVFGILSADDLVVLVYGSTWSGVAPFARLFLVAATIQMVMVPPTWAMQAMGMTGRMLLGGVAFAAVNVTLFAVAGAVDRALWFAGAYVVSSTVCALVNCAIVGSRVDRPVTFFLRPALAPLLASALTVVPVSVAGRALLAPAWYRPVVIAVVGIGLYGVISRRRLAAYVALLRRPSSVPA